MTQLSSSSGDSKNKEVHLGFPYPFCNGPFKVPPLSPLLPPPQFYGIKWLFLAILLTTKVKGAQNVKGLDVPFKGHTPKFYFILFNNYINKNDGRNNIIEIEYFTHKINNIKYPIIVKGINSML